MDTKTCYLTPRFASECLLAVPCGQHLNGLLTMLKYHHILDTQQCEAIMTLSHHKGKQIIKDTIQKRFVRDFLTMLICSVSIGAW
jgi:hypothetical protein